MSLEQFRRRACATSTTRLTKATLLTMLGPSPSPGEQFSSNQSRAFFEKIENPWEIISFNSETKEVCVSIQSPNGMRTVSVKLPDPNPTN